ncbi:MAG: DMT family transporter [Carnobacterium maltaromaticum]
MTLAWSALFVAGLIEIIGVMNIKRLADGKKSALFFAILLMGISLLLLSFALQSIPMGTGYGIWTGIGTVGTTIVGIVVYKDSKSWPRLFFIALILLSTIGLKLLS